MERSVWLDRLAEFFADRDKALSEVLDAGRCREGWLQGELFRAFRKEPGFGVNGFPLADGWADLAADGMVGEVKVLGTWCYPKVITGGSLKPFLAHATRKPNVGPSDRALVLGKWGLIPDYFRLLDANLPDDAVRLVILVADVGEEDTGNVPEALRAVAFDGLTEPVRLARGFVRVWQLRKDNRKDARREAGVPSSSVVARP